jgi:hypothetical protein
MATPPDFSVGATLTAAQMNAVGLWRITGCTVSSSGGTAATASNGVITVGTNNTSITVNNAFNSDFDNYRILYSGGVGTTLISLTLQLGASTTGYYGITNYAAYGTPTTPAAAGDNNATQWNSIGYASTGFTQISCDLLAPNLAKWTTLANASWAAGTVAGSTNGTHQVSTAYTSFTIGVNTGSLTGGKIRVYGYRN